MKEGTTDPFADMDSDDQDDEPDEQASQTAESDQTVDPAPSDSINQSDSSAQEPESEATPSQSASNTEQYDRSDLPRILTRDKVKDDRDDVHQLFVYEDTHEKEKTARRELEDRLGDDIYKLDVREAIYRAGMENLDDAEAILREWGADI